MDITKTIYQTIDQINQGLPPKNQIKKSPAAKIWGKGGSLDSLNLVRFIVSLEERIEKDFKMQINLADEKSFSVKESPFLDVKSLSEHIKVLLEQKNA